MSDTLATDEVRPPIMEARRLSKDPLDHDYECALVFYPNRCPCDCWPIASKHILRTRRQIRLALEGARV